MTTWQEHSERFFSVDQVRLIDQLAIERYQMSSLVLMENAAFGAVQWLRSKFPTPQRCLVLCGRGNNGGDGLAIARHLSVFGWDCKCMVWGPVEKLSSDARANFEILNASKEELRVWNDDQPNCVLDDELEVWLRQSTVILDAMLGTGATGEPRAPLRDWVHLANFVKAFRVAIDIPTGWDAMTGKASSCVFQADATLTFSAKKSAMADPNSATYLGELAVIPIGVPKALLQQLLTSQLPIS